MPVCWPLCFFSSGAMGMPISLQHAKNVPRLASHSSIERSTIGKSSSMCTMCGMPNLLRAIHLSPVLSNPWEDTYHNTIDSANENPRDGSRKNEPVLF